MFLQESRLRANREETASLAENLQRIQVENLELQKENAVMQAERQDLFSLQVECETLELSLRNRELEVTLLAQTMESRMQELQDKESLLLQQEKDLKGEFDRLERREQQVRASGSVLGPPLASDMILVPSSPSSLMLLFLHSQLAGNRDVLERQVQRELDRHQQLNAALQQKMVLYN